MNEDNIGPSLTVSILKGNSADDKMMTLSFIFLR